MSNKDKIYNQLKVFIAGSKVLSEQRNILRAVLMRLQGLFDVMIETKTFEDFSDSLIDGGAQKTLYNQYISSESDVVVFVLDGSIGDYTKQEFDIAYDSYIQNKHPHIYVYCKTGNQSHNIIEFKKELTAKQQYYTEYGNNKELEYFFNKSMNEYLINTFFKNRIRSPKEQVAFDLACQELSITLISCLNVVDELGCVITELNACWSKFLDEIRYSPTNESRLICQSELIHALEHYLNEFQRISKIYPPENISLSKECIELLASEVKCISEIDMLPSMYASYFDDALAPFHSIQNYLSEQTSSVLRSKIIDIHFRGFFNLANAFYYTLLVYMSQLPDDYKKNLKEAQLWWKTYPKNISITLSIDEYERFAKREFDEYERSLIEYKALLTVQDEELDKLKRQIDSIAKEQINKANLSVCVSCRNELVGNETFCPKCGRKLK